MTRTLDAFSRIEFAVCSFKLIDTDATGGHPLCSGKYHGFGKVGGGTLIHDLATILTERGSQKIFALTFTHSFYACPHVFQGAIAKLVKHEQDTQKQM